jgi:phenylpyruvate tautomerase PptA (4-oxalocrotonate tautomerase family)
MPIIEVKMFDHRVDDESAAAVIQELTDGLCAALGEEVRDATWVVVEGVSPKRWGFGGSVKS